MPALGGLNYGAIQSDIAGLAMLLRDYVAPVLGFSLLGFGLYRLVRGAGRGMDTESQIFGGAGLMILSGACLLSIQSFMVMASGSIGAGDGMKSVSLAMGQVKSVGTAEFTAAVQVAFGISWVIGLLGMISGLNTLRVTGQNSQFGFALTKILGGACAMNLPVIIKAAAGWGGIFSEVAKIVS